ncbi:MAG TPA: hypothetical protein VFI42_19545 [Thermomicrobiaceae bacterium]|nr:hypothetical protein [Thermomicrobiaceae bacterium]
MSAPEQLQPLEPGMERIAIVGRGDFADEVARAVQALAELTLAGRVDPGAPLPDGAGLVLCLAEPEERVAVIQQATGAGLPVATLPLTETGDAPRGALGAGRVAQVSALRGYAALETLRAEVAGGALGRPYGVFASHRVRPGQQGLFASLGVPLLHYVYALAGAPVSLAQTTRAAIHGGEPDAWFVIAQTSGGPLLTVEFGAILPAESPAPQELLVEATGSEGVLRGEPLRQSVVVSNQKGTSARPWWSALGPGFLGAALGAIQAHDPAREQGFLDFLGAVYRAVEAGQPAAVA